MADRSAFSLFSNDIDGLTATDPATADEYAIYDASLGANRKTTLKRTGGLFRRAPGGRLSASATLAIADSAATTNIYYQPFIHNDIQLYDGTRWNYFPNIGTLTLALGTLTSGKNYDAFIYNSSGTPTLELSAAWTSDILRADALTTQDGWQVKSGAPTRLWLGTLRTISTTQVQDDLTKRFIWNAFNQVVRQVAVFDSTDSWTYATAAYRQWNNSAANQIEVVTGLDLASTIDLVFNGTASGSGLTMGIAIGEDSTTAFEPTGCTPGHCFGPPAAAATQMSAFLKHAVTLGKHYYAALEYGNAGTITFFGDAGVAFIKNGMVGTWQA